jgi:hypothetical protein
MFKKGDLAFYKPLPSQEGEIVLIISVSHNVIGGNLVEAFSFRESCRFHVPKKYMSPFY